MSQVCSENAAPYMEPKATAAVLKYHPVMTQVSRLCCGYAVYQIEESTCEEHLDMFVQLIILWQHITWNWHDKLGNLINSKTVYKWNKVKLVKAFIYGLGKDGIP